MLRGLSSASVVKEHIFSCYFLSGKSITMSEGETSTSRDGADDGERVLPSDLAALIETAVERAVNARMPPSGGPGE